MKRRQFVQAAVLVPALGFARSRGGIDSYPVWRANGQNMWVNPQGFGGGGNWSQTTRLRHYSTVPFRYARFVIATFYQTGSNPIADVDLPNSYTFQMGLEYPFNLSFTGIPARQTITFSSANTVTYTSGSGPEGYILSDIVDFGAVVPANTYFGIWTTIENVAASGSANNTIPGQPTLSDNYQAGWERYTGVTQATSSLITAGTALTATSIAQASTIQGGGGYGFGPCMMLIQADAHYRSILGVGDCINFGVAEGQLGSLTYGDSLGSALGNVGFPARYCFETLGYNYINFGRGSDAFRWYSATNWKYRLLLAALANPTHVLCQYGHNDVAAAQSVAQILSTAQSLYAGLKGVLPGVPIIQSCIGPGSTSTDSFVTTTNQTAQSGFGSAASVRGTFNDTYVRTNGSALGNAGYIDPNPAQEFGYTEGTTASETSLWNVTGIADGWTQDGTHPNSYGHLQAANNMIAYRNGSLVTDPFAT